MTTTTTDLAALIGNLCQGLQSLQNERASTLAREIKSARGSCLAELMSQTIALTGWGVEGVRRLEEENAETIHGALETAEVQFLEISSSREKFDDLTVQVENLLREATDVLQNHLPSAANSLKAIQFGRSVLLHFHNHQHAEELVKKAQHRRYCLDCVVVSSIFDEVSLEVAEIFQAAGAMLGRKLEPSHNLVFRPPGFSSVPLFTVWDTYEQFRNAGQGAGLPRTLKPLEKPAAWIAKRLKVPVKAITAGLALQSLAQSRRTASRRDLIGALAEQMRRNNAAALQQLQSSLKEAGQQLRKAVTAHFECHRLDYGGRVRELNRRLRQSRQIAIKIERTLMSCERIAREIMGHCKRSN